MWELDCEESWVPKNWCFSTVVLEKTLVSLLDCKEIQPDHPKGDQSWVYIVRTDAEAETPILWSPHAKSWLIGRDPNDGRDWGQEEKGTTEDEMARWHHRLYGHEFVWTPGVGDGQGGLACCNSWGRKESDTAEQVKWIELRGYNCFYFPYVSHVICSLSLLLSTAFFVKLVFYFSSLKYIFIRPFIKYLLVVTYSVLFTWKLFTIDLVK